MKAKGRNEIIEEYINFLKDKGRITKIKDTTKELNIKLSSGIIYYFLLVISIALGFALIFGGRALVIEQYELYDGAGLESVLIALAGISLFWIILVGVTIYERKNKRITVFYPDDETIRINNRIYNIKKEDCQINILKSYKSVYNSTTGMPASYLSIEYRIEFLNNGKRAKYLITKGTEENFKNLIYNFEYELSETKKQSMELIQENHAKFFEEE